MLQHGLAPILVLDELLQLAQTLRDLGQRQQTRVASGTAVCEAAGQNIELDSALLHRRVLRGQMHGPEPLQQLRQLHAWAGLVHARKQARKRACRREPAQQRGFHDLQQPAWWLQCLIALVCIRVFGVLVELFGIVLLLVIVALLSVVAQDRLQPAQRRVLCLLHRLCRGHTKLILIVEVRISCKQQPRALDDDKRRAQRLEESCAHSPGRQLLDCARQTGQKLLDGLLDPHALLLQVISGVYALQLVNGQGHLLDLQQQQRLRGAQQVLIGRTRRLSQREQSRCQAVQERQRLQQLHGELLEPKHGHLGLCEVDLRLLAAQLLRERPHRREELIAKPLVADLHLRQHRVRVLLLQ
mmetsp:Transcript_22639/g.53751  ORF Transcript_22639/g.53751 Transcript_22639/m.53751 type:complete len:356 (+) Transcript_22639:527-1594(+)